jgi:hypothetical protein
VSNENAIVEETDEVIEVVEEDNLTEQDDYDITEPEDDDVEEFKVPVIDSLDDDEEVKPQVKETKAKQQEEESEPVEANKEQPDKAVKPEKTDDSLIQKAKKLGISDDDIRLFNSPDQLERLIHLVEPNHSIDKEVETKSDTKQEYSADNDGEFRLDLDPELYDPQMFSALESTAKEINTLKSTLNNVLGTIQRQNAQSFEQEFEGMLAGLGDDFADTLGRGRLADIGTDSDFYKNRCRLIDEMNAIAAGYSQTGKPLPAPKDLFNRAVNGLFGEKIKKNTLKEITDKVAKRSNQIIARPTGKLGKDIQTPEKRAANAVRQKLQEFGAYEDTEVSEDF